MRYYLALITIAFITLTGSLSQVHAQGYKLSTQPDTFIVDLGNYLKYNRKLPTAQIVDSFSTAWSAMDEGNQKRVITIVRYMAKKKPHKALLVISYLAKLMQILKG